MSNHYLDNLAREVNERLQQRGTLPVPSLTKEYDLPTEFLLDQVRLFLYNEWLQQRGTLPVPSPTKEYDLPTEFLLDQVRFFL